VVASFQQLEHYGLKELEDKTVITSTVSDARLSQLKDKGVRLVIDCSLQLFPEIVGLNVVEAMVIAALDKPAGDIAHDDYLDIMKVKPGCVITDVARPLDLPPEEVAKRPDVLVIESG